MRKTFLLLPIAMSFCLGSCFFSFNNDNAEWRSVEQFFSHTEGHRIEDCYYQVSKYDNITKEDEEFKIKNAFLEVSSIEDSKSFKPTEDRYLTYTIFESNSTSGPNKGVLTLYSDGSLRIVRYHAIGTKGVTNYQMSSEDALRILELAELEIEAII